MFQRKAKTYRAAAFDGPEKIDTFKLARLFEEAAEETKEMEGDVSFYMGQVADFFRNHYKPGRELKAHKVLGL